MRGPLTATINRVQGMIAYVRENLILPEPEPVKVAKKGRKKSSKSASKSSRASEMAATLKKSQQQRRVTKGDDDADNGKKGMAGPLCQTCGNFEQHEDHSHPSPHYHEFDAGKSSAPRAGAKSSTNGGAKVTTANSEDETVSAGAVAGGLGE